MILLNLYLTDWLQRNIFYVVVAIILLFLIFILSCLIVKFYLDKVKETKDESVKEGKLENSKGETKPKKEPKKIKDKNINITYDEIISNLGGKDNIVEMTTRGSRLSVVLKDNTLLNVDALKDIGVDGVIVMTSKVTLVIGEDAPKLKEYFEK
ncbi:MAG: hypothetical protein ACI311_03315 [Bacilli bacterium]